MSRISFVAIMLVVAYSAQSQALNQDSLRKRTYEYYFQVQSGAMIGCSSCSRGKEISFSGATTHGIKFGNKLRVGAGVGLDSYYNWNVVPVFGSVNYDLFGKKNTVFVEFNYGGAVVARRQVNYEEFGYKDSDGGLMYGFGLGYRIKYEDVRISLGIGHKTQHITYYYEYPTLYWNNGDFVAGEPSRKTIKNEMNRLMIWLAVGWQ